MTPNNYDPLNSDNDSDDTVNNAPYFTEIECQLDQDPNITLLPAYLAIRLSYSLVNRHLTDLRINQTIQTIFGEVRISSNNTRAVISRSLLERNGVDVLDHHDNQEIPALVTSIELCYRRISVDRAALTFLQYFFLLSDEFEPDSTTPIYLCTFQVEDLVRFFDELYYGLRDANHRVNASGYASDGGDREMNSPRTLYQGNQQFT